VLTYKYKAINEQGKFANGSMEAANPTDLEMRLQRMGLDLINYRDKERGLFSRGHRKITRADLITFSFHLEQLTRAGVPLIDALKDLRDTTDQPTFQSTISQVIEGIEGGKTFSGMLEQFPQVFGSVYASMVKVGERSGRLPDVLRDLAEMTKWQDELIARVKRAMMYPAFVSVVVFFMLMFIMTFLVPNLVRFVQSTGHELPFHTRALLATSKVFVDYWYLIIVVPIAIPLAVRYGKRLSPRFRYQWDMLLLNAWVIGPVMYRFKLARFANYSAMMYASGITVLDALSLGRQIVDNLVLDDAIERVRVQISDGESISNSFAQAGLFPPLVVRMMRVGEGSGELDKAFLQISYFYSREAQEAVGRMEQFIGPALILLVAGLMLWVIMSVIGPIYDAIFTVGATI